MLTEGTKNARWVEEADPGKPIPEGEQHWFEKVNFHTLGIPFAKRPKGGKRYNFAGFDFEYMIADIKEQSCGRFKNAIDVNRNAHFIGMNILHQMYAKNKKSGLREKLAQKLKDSKKTLRLKETLCSFFKDFYDEYADGMMTFDELMDRAADISEEVYDEKVRDWFLEYCSGMAQNKDFLRKTKDRIRKKKAYNSNIRLVEEM